jgi:CubicO group peptidase (beta-lactamase class C family)
MPLEDVDRVMNSAVEEGVFPGAVLQVTCGNGAVYENAYGWISERTGPKAEINTVYDLASLTKALSTAPVFMVLVQDGKIGLESQLGDILPDFADTPKQYVTVAQLLTHTSGLPDYRPYYKELSGLPETERWNCLKKRLIDEPLITEPGSSVLYSDLGYMILAWIVERVSGQSVSGFVKNRVYDPLDVVELYCGGERIPAGSSVAPSEDCPWRKRVVCGDVHDENAWVMGGYGGHAGLFGTARGVGQMLDEYVKVFRGERESTVFERKILRRFLSEWETSRRTPGFDMPSREGSSSGRFFSPESVGHLGFTGTSFWMDLEKEVRVVLLSNRVYPCRENIKIRTWRPIIHDAVMLALENTVSF